MKNLIAFAASVAVNLAVLGALDFSALRAAVPPAGEVSVTQLPSDIDLPAYASALEVAPQQAVL